MEFKSTIFSNTEAITNDYMKTSDCWFECSRALKKSLAAYGDLP